MERDLKLVLNVASSSEDEDFHYMLTRRNKKVNIRANHFEDLDEEEFRARFRLSRASVEVVMLKIQDEIVQHEMNNAISPLNQLLLTLRFYATGNHLISAADFSGVSKTSAHRIVQRVTEAIARLRPEKIRFPATEGEIHNAQIQFYKIAFPRVVGCVDCTHVKVQSFGGENAELFRNRKGYFSINMQAICNANLEIIDLVARWQGSVHDSTIFNSSKICAMFESGKYQDAILLGDSGYALRPLMLTPLRNPQMRAELLYNESQIRTRNIIERLFGIWKRRFPVLAIGCRFQKPESAVAVIVATGVLHNIARQFSDPEPPNDSAVIPLEMLQDHLDPSCPMGMYKIVAMSEIH